MAAATTTYFEAGRSWNARVAERNAELFGKPAPEEMWQELAEAGLVRT